MVEIRFCVKHWSNSEEMANQDTNNANYRNDFRALWVLNIPHQLIKDTLSIKIKTLAFTKNSLFSTKFNQTHYHCRPIRITMIKLKIVPIKIHVMIFTFIHKFHIVVNSTTWNEEAHFAIVTKLEIHLKPINYDYRSSEPKETTEAKGNDAFVESSQKSFVYFIVIYQYNRFIVHFFSSF